MNHSVLEIKDISENFRILTATTPHRCCCPISGPTNWNCGDGLVGGIHGDRERGIQLDNENVSLSIVIHIYIPMY